MNGTDLHLVVNHFPIFSTLFGIAILSWGLFKKSIQVRRIGTVLLILGAITSYIALESGETAEEELEGSSLSISHESIHDHEEAAEISFWFSIVLGCLASVSLMTTRTNMNTRMQTTLNGVLLITGILTLLMLIYTSYEGGKIRHNQRLGESNEMFDQELKLRFSHVSEYLASPQEN